MTLKKLSKKYRRALKNDNDNLVGSKQLTTERERKESWTEAKVKSQKGKTKLNPPTLEVATAEHITDLTPTRGIKTLGAYLKELSLDHCVKEVLGRLGASAMLITPVTHELENCIRLMLINGDVKQRPKATPVEPWWKTIADRRNAKKTNQSRDHDESVRNDFIGHPLEVLEKMWNNGDPGEDYSDSDKAILRAILKQKRGIL